MPYRNNEYEDNQCTFNCDKCGLCCQHLRDFGDLYHDLDDGTGCCRYYDSRTRLCRIYDIRPLKCRVKEGYSTYFNSISFSEYLAKTRLGCMYLKEKYGSHEQNKV